MSRRAVLAATTATLVLGGLAAPALAGPSDAGESSKVCVITHYDPNTGHREGVCVWVPTGGSTTLG